RQGQSAKSAKKHLPGTLCGLCALPLAPWRATLVFLSADARLSWQFAGAAHHRPGVGPVGRTPRVMKLKQQPEDFQVEELTDVAPAGAGPFALYRMTKRGWTTHDALLAVRRRWQLDQRRLSYGG